MEKQSDWQIQFRHKGKLIIGRFYIEGEGSAAMIVVTTDKGGKKTTQLGGHVGYPEGLARLLLVELANEGKA
jgi:hypothetical protein